MHKKILTILFLLVFSIFAQNKISIVTTLFPLFDFAKIISGEKADVTLLLPPAVEPHSFEPTPKDMVKINKADLFIFTSDLMEPWVEKLLGSVNKNVVILESGEGLCTEDHECDHSDDNYKKEHHHDNDPHIWLDPYNCIKITDIIGKTLINKDPSNEQFYTDNMNKLKKDLTSLDREIKMNLSLCESKTILYAGHFAFGYFVKRYNLNFETTYHGFSPDAEPSAKKMATLIKTVKEKKAKAIFYEALTEPRLAKTIANETGAEMILLHPVANLSRNDFKANKTYISIMKENLLNLKKGLQCK